MKDMLNDRVGVWVLFGAVMLIVMLISSLLVSQQDASRSNQAQTILQQGGGLLYSNSFEQIWVYPLAQKGVALKRAQETYLLGTYRICIISKSYEPELKTEYVIVKLCNGGRSGKLTTGWEQDPLAH